MARGKLDGIPLGAELCVAELSPPVCVWIWLGSDSVVAESVPVGAIVLTTGPCALSELVVGSVDTDNVTVPLIEPSAKPALDCVTFLSRPAGVSSNGVGFVSVPVRVVLAVFDTGTVGATPVRLRESVPVGEGFEFVAGMEPSSTSVVFGGLPTSDAIVPGLEAGSEAVALASGMLAVIGIEGVAAVSVPVKPGSEIPSVTGRLVGIPVSVGVSTGTEAELRSELRRLPTTAGSVAVAKEDVRSDMALLKELEAEGSSESEAATPETTEAASGRAELRTLGISLGGVLGTIELAKEAIG